MRVGMIWAEACGAAIGRAGKMPWHLPEDLAHFKRITLGTPVVMGRRTWESLPERMRPLSGRTNIVVTKDPAYVAPGAIIQSSLNHALAAITPPTPTPAHTPDQVDVWVMGGAQLYRSAMPVADELIVTRIDLTVPEADTFAPDIGPEWLLSDPGEPLVAANGLGYRFERWVRGRNPKNASSEGTRARSVR